MRRERKSRLFRFDAWFSFSDLAGVSTCVKVIFILFTLWVRESASMNFICPSSIGNPSLPWAWACTPLNKKILILNTLLDTLRLSKRAISFVFWIRYNALLEVLDNRNILASLLLWRLTVDLHVFPKILRSNLAEIRLEIWRQFEPSILNRKLDSFLSWMASWGVSFKAWRRLSQEDLFRLSYEFFRMSVRSIQNRVSVTWSNGIYTVVNSPSKLDDSRLLWCSLSLCRAVIGLPSCP